MKQPFWKRLPLRDTETDIPANIVSTVGILKHYLSDTEAGYTANYNVIATVFGLIAYSTFTGAGGLATLQPALPLVSAFIYLFIALGNLSCSLIQLKRHQFSVVVASVVVAALSPFFRLFTGTATPGIILFWIFMVLILFRWGRGVVGRADYGILTRRAIAEIEARERATPPDEAEP